MIFWFLPIIKQVSFTASVFYSITRRWKLAKHHASGGTTDCVRRWCVMSATSPSSSWDCSRYNVSRRCSFGSRSMYESSWRSDVSLSLSSLFSRPSGSDSSWSCSPSLSDLSEYRSGSFKWSLSLNLGDGKLQDGVCDFKRWLQPGFLSYSLEPVDVMRSEEAVEVNGVFSAGADYARVLFALADHGPLQQAGALQGQL